MSVSRRYFAPGQLQFITSSVYGPRLAQIAAPPFSGTLPRLTPVSTRHFAPAQLQFTTSSVM